MEEQVNIPALPYFCVIRDTSLKSECVLAMRMPRRYVGAQDESKD
jgi:hypothetical protein